jgi:hypothetical protein
MSAPAVGLILSRPLRARSGKSGVWTEMDLDQGYRPADQGKPSASHTGLVNYEKGKQRWLFDST